MTKRVKEILSWYDSANAGVRTNLARMMNHGKLAGTGKMVILPVDQGFEHGPARSFAPNPPAYNPRYHFEFAIEAGCNAYAAPLGFLEAGAADFAGDIPLILKLNNHDVLLEEKDPASAVTGSVKDALRAGMRRRSASRSTPARRCAARCTSSCASSRDRPGQHGLCVVVWSYPRGSGISKDGETALDVCGYAAQIAAQLGAHIIKVKLPSAHLEQAEAKKVYEETHIPLEPLSERVRHVVQCCFRRPPDRDFLGRRQGGRRDHHRGGARHPQGRRLRLDYRPQLLPAPAPPGARAAPPGYRNLRRSIEGRSRPGGATFPHRSRRHAVEFYL